jgi:hypothetical protein
MGERALKGEGSRLMGCFASYVAAVVAALLVVLVILYARPQHL